MDGDTETCVAIGKSGQVKSGSLGVPGAQASGLVCDRCGYLRFGLPAESNCPECGSPPPEMMLNLDLQGNILRTRGEGRWRLIVGAGLLLLIVSSIFALHVTLIMPVNRLAVPAMNVVGAKVHLASLLQRQISGRPGEWGVAGWIASFGCLIATWLITWPRYEIEMVTTSRLRCWARRVCVLSGGAVAGAVVSPVTDYISPGGEDARRMLAILLFFGELPANFFLLAYLAKLSKRICSASAGRAMRIAVIGFPIVSLGGCAMLLYTTNDDFDLHPLRLQALCGAYMAGAVAIGMITSAGVLRLAVSLLAGSVGSAVRRLLKRSRWTHEAMSRFIRQIERNRGRICVALGVLLWVQITLAEGMNSIGRTPSRHGLDGDVAMSYHTGPRFSAISVSGFLGDFYYQNSPRLGVLWQLLPIWLICSGLPGYERHLRIHRMRWGIRLVVLAYTGMLLVIHNTERAVWIKHHPVVAYLICVVAFDALMTFAIYRHLANMMARLASPAVAGRLRVQSYLASVLIVGMFLFDMSLLRVDTEGYEILVWICAGAVKSVSLGVSLWTITTMLRGVYAMFRQALERPRQLGWSQPLVAEERERQLVS